MHTTSSTRHTTRTRPGRGVRRRGAAAVAALALATGVAPATPSWASAAPPSAAATTPGSAASSALATAVSSVMQRHPYCGIVWGSLARTNGTTHTTGTVQDVRAGRHTCFDRLVVDVGEVPGRVTYAVRYVEAVREDGSGAVVPLAGGADLQIVVRAPAYAEGSPTYSPADPGHLADVRGWDTFRQVALAGSFEGQTTVGLGVRARLPFRAFVLDGPGDGARLVVDVAHRW